MRKHVYVRPARPEDRDLFIKWTAENRSRNAADPAVIGYPTTFILCAYDHDGPLAYMPVQQPMMLESLAPRPGLDEVDTAMALRELVKAIVTQAHLKGSGEIYFISDEETIQKFARNQIFEQLPVNIYRLKLSDLEK